MSIITAMSLLLALTLGSGGTAVELGAARPAPGKLLVSSEGSRDPNFAESVVLLITYDKGGAMGLILNRRSDVKLNEVLPDVERLKNREDPVYFGGPVSPNRLFLLVRSVTPLDLAHPVVDDVHVSESPQLLEQLLEKGIEAEFRAFGGYAGWGAGQLDGEIERGGWHIVEGSADRIFAQRPAALWRSLVPRNSMEWSRLIPAGEQ